VVGYAASGDPLSNHQLDSGSEQYPGMYFPPENGLTKNPFNYDFTIGNAF
jgi:hypothetical protein